MEILYILVLYQQKLADTISYQTLVDGLRQVPHSYQLLIYDNSPLPQAVEPTERMIYNHDENNGGIQAAYQYGFEIAKKRKIDWLCFLDQDTRLSPEYLNEIQKQMKQFRNEPNLVSLVPLVKNQERMISPTFANTVRPLRQKNTPTTGINLKPITAISSGTCIKTTFVDSIGGFHSPFSLDYFDHWLFWQIAQLQKKVFVLDTILIHDLSVLHYQDLSSERYRSILSSENQFYQQYAIQLRPDFRRQLFLRSIKQVLTVKNKQIAKETFRLWLNNFFKKKTGK